IKGDIFLKTNDPASPLVPVLVEANVQAPLSVLPDTLSLGAVKVGDTVVERVQVRGTKPFRVTGVAGAGKDVTSEVASAEPRTVQIVTLHYQVGQPGDFHRELKIKTDLQDAPVTVTIEGTASP